MTEAKGSEIKVRPVSSGFISPEKLEELGKKGELPASRGVKSITLSGSGPKVKHHRTPR